MIKPVSLPSLDRAPEVLDTLMEKEVVRWLDPKTLSLLIDYVNIKYCWGLHGVGQLSDYAYLMTPAFKALEGVLIQVAGELRLPERPYRIGAVYDEESLDKFYSEVLDKVGALTETAKDDVKLWLNDARRILKHYRHSPAHFQSEPKTHWDRAFQQGDQIVNVVNQLCGTLLEARLIGKRPEPPERTAQLIV
jgi:hypothetical protein